MNKKDYLRLSISLALPFLTAYLGSVFTETGPDSWYENLNKPLFNPPDWIFAPVWTVLFVMMGVAAFLVWRQGLKKKEVRSALLLFLLQLAFNLSWSYFFFGLQNPRLAFLGIIALWLSIVAVMIAFYRLDKRSSWLLWPYLAWVSFASLLNYEIWRLN